MRQRSLHATEPAKRRTTLTLPADSLQQAERIAQIRKVNLSTVISEALSDGLRSSAAVERSEAILKSYRKAFSGFTEEEIAILNGVILDPVSSQ